ncbi:MAG: amino acid ABC transporter substrate-binding protein [Pseudomonadota bacterium]
MICSQLTRCLTTLGAALALGALIAGPAGAASTTLDRIAERGELRVGYVPDAPPMSFRGEGEEPSGYSIALCRRVAAAIQKAVQLDEMSVSYVPLVTPRARLRAVEEGEVDLECGATTVTLSRRERVDFSLMTFITGGAVLSMSDAEMASTSDLAGKKLAVITGSTTEDALLRFRETNDIAIELRVISNHLDGMKLLKAGEVDGFASDRAMLIGQVVQRGEDPKDYRLTRNVFSFEPYALMLPRGDTEFRLVVDSALAELYRSITIQRVYHDWFGKYGEPLPEIVRAMYESQAIAE